jgi:putative spermidine/putrescine transport system substrate-binding protein
MALSGFVRRVFLAGVVAAATTGFTAIDRATAQETLRILVFGGTLGEGFLKAVDGFQKENNVKFVVTNSTSIQGLTRLMARAGQEPEWDIIHSSPSTHFIGTAAGLWEEISPDLVPNMKRLAPAAVDRNKYVGWGVVEFGLMVNTEALRKAGAPEPKSWKDLWRPEYKGRIAIFDFANLYGQGFFDMVRQLEGSDDKAFDALKRMRPNVRQFPFTPAEVDNLMLQQEIWIAPNADSRAKLLARKGAPIKYIRPDDGPGVWPMYLDIPKRSPKRDLALKFTNYVLSPKVQADLALHAEVGPVNLDTQLSDEAKAKNVVDVNAIGSMRQVGWETLVPQLQDLSARWMEKFQN